MSAPMYGCVITLSSSRKREKGLCCALLARYTVIRGEERSYRNTMHHMHIIHPGGAYLLVFAALPKAVQVLNDGGCQCADMRRLSNAEHTGGPTANNKNAEQIRSLFIARTAKAAKKR